MDQFQPKTLSGKPLRPSVSTGAQLQRTLTQLTDEMIRDTRRELRELWSQPVTDAADGDWMAVMDASIASQAQRIINKMTERFTLLFNKAADSATRVMVERTLTNSATDLKSSLRQLAGQITLSTDVLTGQLRDVVTASINESVSLFKTIPEKYFSKVQGDVMRSIIGGNGIKDLMTLLQAHDTGIRNWVTNTSLDQHRKVYNNIVAGRSQALGIQSFRWIHAGNAKVPRPLHIHKWPDGLNGGIFRYDDLPVIGVMYGAEVRGIPGTLPNCSCLQQSVFNVSDYE